MKKRKAVGLTLAVTLLFALTHNVIASDVPGPDPDVLERAGITPEMNERMQYLRENVKHKKELPGQISKRKLVPYPQRSC